MSSYRLGKTISMWNMLKQPPSTLSSTLSFYYITFFKILLCERVVALISLNYLPEAWPSDPVSNQSIGEKSLELQCSNALLPAHARMCQLPTISNEGMDWKRPIGRWVNDPFKFFWLVGWWIIPFQSWVYMTWFEGWFTLHIITWHDLFPSLSLRDTKTSKP